MDTATPPRPGHEPFTTTPEPVGAELIVDKTLSLSIDYLENGLQDGTVAFLRLSEREKLRAYVRGVKIAGGATPSWRAGLDPADYSYIWEHHIRFLDGVLDSGNVPHQERIAGFLLFEEPESLASHRLPRAAPEVCGIQTLNNTMMVEGTTVDLNVIATNRAFAFDWDFDPTMWDTTGMTAPEIAAERAKPSPSILLGPAGTYLIRVRAINWWSEEEDAALIDAEYEPYTVTVHSAIATPPAPEITGGVTQVFSLDPGFTQLGFVTDQLRHKMDLVNGTWEAFGGAFGIRPNIAAPDATTRQAVRLAFLALNETTSHAWTFTGLTETPAGLGYVGSGSGDPAPTVRFPAQQNLVEREVYFSGSVTISNANGSTSPSPVPFRIRQIRPNTIDSNEYREKCLPPPNWVTRQFLQDLAWLIWDMQKHYITEDSMPGRGETPKPVVVNHNACAIASHFHRQGLGCGFGFDPAPTREVIRLDPPPWDPDWHEIHLLDDYPLLSATERTNRAASDEPNVRASAVIDPVRPFDRLLRLREIVEVVRLEEEPDVRHGQPDIPDGGTPGTSPPPPPLYLAPKRWGFWLQAWGNEPAPDDPSPDPDPVTPADGAAYRKPTLREIRFQAWMAIALDCEILGFFAQYYLADTLISSHFNQIAKEIYLYHDLRFNRIVRAYRSDSLASQEYGSSDDPYVVWRAEADGSDPSGYFAQLPPMLALLERRSGFEDPKLSVTRPAGELVLVLINPRPYQTTFRLRATPQLVHRLSQEGSTVNVRLEPMLAGGADPDNVPLSFQWNAESFLGDIPISLARWEVRLYHMTFEAV